MPLNNMVGLGNVDLSGGIGGLFAGIQNRQAEDENNLLIAMQALKNRQQGLESGRYEQETPDYLRKVGGEADVSQYKGSLATMMRNDPTFMREVMSGERGEAQTKSAKGALDTALLPSTIERGRASNQEDIDIFGAGRMLRDLNDAFIASQRAGPAGEAAFQAAVAKMPDNNLKQMFLTATPQQRAALFPKIEQMLRQKMLTSEKAQTSLAGIEATGDWHIKVEGIQARSRAAIEAMKEGRADDRALLGIISANQREVGTLLASARPEITALEERRGSMRAQREDYVALAQRDGIKVGSREYEVKVAQRDPNSWYQERNDAINAEIKAKRERAEVLSKFNRLLQQAALAKGAKREALFRDAFAVMEEDSKKTNPATGERATTIQYDKDGNRIK